MAVVVDFGADEGLEEGEVRSGAILCVWSLEMPEGRGEEGGGKGKRAGELPGGVGEVVGSRLCT